MDDSPQADRPGRVVTCTYEASQQSNDREARALRRWQLTRRAFWLRWALAWAGFVVAVLVGVYLLVRWLAPEATGFLSWAVLLGGGMMVAAALVDAATLRQRWLLRYQKVVERQTPPGTPVQQTFSTTAFTITTPRSTFAVPATSVRRASWTRGCLVLEGEGGSAWVVNGDGIDDEAMQLAIEVLGGRLRKQ